MVLLKNKEEELFENKNSALQAVQTAIVELANEVHNLRSDKELFNKTILYKRYFETVECLKNENLKYFALLQKENVLSDQLALMKNVKSKGVYDETNEDGKPKFSNAERREIALYDRLNADQDYQSVKESLNQTSFDKRHTEVLIANFKLDIKRFDLAFGVGGVFYGEH